MKFETRAIHVGEEPNFKEGGYGDVVSPIHLSSTFARQKVDAPTQGYVYSRSGNPTRHAVEKRLATLENAAFGLAFASGLAAETTLFLSMLKSQDHVIAFDDLYGGSKRLFNRVLQERFNIQFTYVDARNLDEIQKSILPNTKVICIETPTNPLLKIGDIQKISALAKKHHLLTVVDNTFMSPYFQQPLNLGADLVFHSSTKYLNGHSDSIGGAVMLNDPELYEKIRFTQNTCGAILSPFDSYLLLRGIKTLAVRMKQHESNALKLSQYLENHKKVIKVNYPGLPSHPEYALAQAQMSGFGGMLSFELKTDLEGSKRFVESLQYFSIAESLGGVESLCEIPSLMTHASIPKIERDKTGLSDSLIRLSVGIENQEDLQQDLEQAFKVL